MKISKSLSWKMTESRSSSVAQRVRFFQVGAEYRNSSSQSILTRVASGGRRVPSISTNGSDDGAPLHAGSDRRPVDLQGRGRPIADRAAWCERELLEIRWRWGLALQRHQGHDAGCRHAVQSQHSRTFAGRPTGDFRQRRPDRVRIRPVETAWHAIIGGRRGLEPLRFSQIEGRDAVQRQIRRAATACHPARRRHPVMKRSRRLVRSTAGAAIVLMGGAIGARQVPQQQDRQPPAPALRPAVMGPSGGVSRGIP